MLTKAKADLILEKLQKAKGPSQVLNIIQEAQSELGVNIMELHSAVEKARVPGESIEQAFRRVVERAATKPGM